MATIDAKTGQIIGGTDMNAGGDPYSKFANNITQMLTEAQKKGAEGNTALAGQIGGLERGQAALGRPGEANPLNFLYNMSSAGNLAGEQSQMSKIFEPGITSIQGQMDVANRNLENINKTAETALSAYEKMKPVWELSPIPNENGDFYYYNSNTPAGQAPQTYAAGKIPNGVGGSTGGSPQSADHVKTLAQSNNPYGIKMSSTNHGMFEPLGGTPGPGAQDGGNFWSFPDITSGEKAAKTLLTSNVYANDSVDQALRQWSNYTGTGKYPGYNGSIMAGTGIDPNSKISSLTPAQIDVVLDKMKHAEAVGTTTQGTGSLIDQTAQLIASGKSGITFDDAFNSLNTMYGGKITKTQLITAVQKYNPNFNINTSSGTATGQQQNTVTLATIKPQIDVANAIMDGAPSIGGQPAVESITAKFDKLPYGMKSGSVPMVQSAIGMSNMLGAWKTEIQDYQRALQDLRAKANSVLTAGFNLGVVKGGETADSLFPDNMTKESLAKAIQTVKEYEDQIVQKLSIAGGGTVGGTPIESLRSKYNY